MHVLSWPAAGQILKNPAIQVYKTNEINYIQEARNRSVDQKDGNKDDTGSTTVVLDQCYTGTVVVVLD